MKDITSHNIYTFTSLIKEAQSIAVVGHMKPDGDALGSCLGMYHYLSLYGKENVKIVLPHRTQAYLNFIIDKESSKDILIHEEHPKKAEEVILESDLIICLDFNAFHRTDRLENALTESSAAKILIDHHLNPDREKFTLSFSEISISSASELVYQILMSTYVISGDAGKLPMKSAIALMTGMTTDTNNFANSVYPSTLRMAADLIEAGVDRDMIVSSIYQQHRETRMRLMGHVLKDLMTITSDGVAYIILDKKVLQEYCIEEGDTEGFVNMPLSIAKVKMSLLLKEDGNMVRVSIRSKKGVSANRCSKLHFHGGGHENAAGGRLYIPDDISGIGQAAAYIEEHTHTFMIKENEE
ncbi:MAG: DHH family phosphoesterase [Bacteroidales bacterium]|nr:DHH family phosphoesterase [Bacteroidales bacterium]